MSRILTRLQQRYEKVALLIVDELGFVPFERTGGVLLFNQLAQRYERQATIITTNLPFGILTTRGDSYRSQRGRSNREPTAAHGRPQSSSNDQRDDRAAAAGGAEKEN